LNWNWIDHFKIFFNLPHPRTWYLVNLC